MAFLPTFQFESVLHGKIYAQYSTFNFQSVLHANANTWTDAGTLKVKYPVNAENFKRILQLDGLIF